jgi:hypothetical protein
MRAAAADPSARRAPSRSTSCPHGADFFAVFARCALDTFQRLAQFERLDLRVVLLLLPRADGISRLFERQHVLRQSALDALRLCGGGLGLLRQLAAAYFEGFDFGLAREDPGIGGIGGVEADRMARELVAFHG